VSSDLVVGACPLDPLPPLLSPPPRHRLEDPPDRSSVPQVLLDLLRVSDKALMVLDVVLWFWMWFFGSGSIDLVLDVIFKYIRIYLNTYECI